MIYDRYVKAWENLDVEGYLACHHEDYEILFHSTGKVMRLKDFSGQIGSWMVASKFENRRLIYENEDILFTHNIATLVMAVGKRFYSQFLKKMVFFGVEKLGQSHYL